MRQLIRLFLFVPIFSSLTTAEKLRPRGVGPDLAKFYKSETTFSCISNPSITIKSSQVNDDFCDCPDGSDEPGTAACTLISAHLPPHSIVASSYNSSIVLPGFYCKNIGHIPAYLPHVNVNDGVCDYDYCCDGSDESIGVGGIRCTDKCREIGKEWRRLDKIKQDSLQAALKMRIELVKEAHTLKNGVEKSIAELEREIAQTEKLKAELKAKFEDLQRQERGRMVLSSGKNSKVVTLAGIAKTRVNELKETLLRVISRRDALLERVRDLEGILTRFKEEYNPNFNDEGVKRAVKAWEDYAAARVSDQNEDFESEDKKLETTLIEDSGEHNIDWDKWEAEESDNGILEKLIQCLPKLSQNWVRNKVLDFRILLAENSIVPGGKIITSESEIVTMAREAFQSASDDLSVKHADLGKLQADLAKDYGIDEVFRALKDSCIEKDSGEYIYELCWLKDTKQKSKKGGGHTGMGTFTNFDSMVVDEELSPDGKGLGSGKRLTLKYEHGQGCWNGPSRETTVVLGCSETDEIWKIVELEKCIYRMDVGTPAACEREKIKKKPDNKKEL